MPGVAFSALEEELAHYVQLIRGKDEDLPPAPDVNVVGPKLANSLHSGFRWKA